MVPDDGFYIFMIWNKRLESNNRIYDLKKNIYFEDKDISVDVMFDGEDLDEFVREAKSWVKKKTYSATSITPTTGNYPGYYGGARNYYGNPYNPNVSALPSVTEEKNEKPKSADDKNRVRIGIGWTSTEGQLGWE